jgi:hypothetical protein
MRLIEILTQPYLKNCECAPCFLGTYLDMADAVVGLESEALVLLNEPNLSELLKLDGGAITHHSRARFSILLSLVKDPQRKLIFLKNLILNPQFDLNLLDLNTLYEYNRKEQRNGRREYNLYRAKWHPDIDRVVKNAPIFRKFPELMDNKILPYEPQRTIRYVKEIYEMGMNQFSAYFGYYFRDEMILITHVLFEEYLKSNQKELVPLIQKAYLQIEGNRARRVLGTYNHSHKELTNKILSQSNHKCLPFETPNFGAKTIDEYLCYLDQTNRVKEGIENFRIDVDNKAHRINSKIGERLKQIASIEEEINVLKKQLQHNRRSQTRFEELRRLGDFHPLDRLKYIIESERPVFYFPEFMFEDSMEYVQDLPEEQKLRFQTKLKTAKRGILKKLKLFLLA